jgi:hypothetical protein
MWYWKFVLQLGGRKREGEIRGWERRTEEIRSTEKFLLMFPLKLSLCLGNGTIPQGE